MSFLKPERPTATNALNIPSIRSPNIKKEKKVKLPKEEDVMTENNQDMEDKPNPSSERKLKPPRKSPSDCNAPSAKLKDASSSVELNLLFSWRSKKSERKRPVKQTLCSDDHSTYLNHLSLIF